MTSVTLAPNAAEWAVAEAQYGELTEALREIGYDAWIQEPRDNIFRTGGIVTDPLIDLSIFLWEHVSEEAIGALIALVVERLHIRRARRARQTAVIYGLDGRVLRQVRLDSSDEDDLRDRPR